jgi:hypothetical protein
MGPICPQSGGIHKFRRENIPVNKMAYYRFRKAVFLPKRIKNVKKSKNSPGYSGILV